MVKVFGISRRFNYTSHELYTYIISIATRLQKSRSKHLLLQSEDGLEKSRKRSRFVRKFRLTVYKADQLFGEVFIYFYIFSAHPTFIYLFNYIYILLEQKLYVILRSSQQVPVATGSGFNTANLLQIYLSPQFPSNHHQRFRNISFLTH